MYLFGNETAILKECQSAKNAGRYKNFGGKAYNQARLLWKVNEDESVSIVDDLEINADNYYKCGMYNPSTTKIYTLVASNGRQALFENTTYDVLSAYIKDGKLDFSKQTATRATNIYTPRVNTQAINITQGGNYLLLNGTAMVNFVNHSPATKPSVVGLLWVDTSNGSLYIAKGTSAVTDWVEIRDNHE